MFQRAEWERRYPELADVFAQRETVWCNPRYMPLAQAALPAASDSIRDAEERLVRFAPFLKTAFPETRARDGLIESPLTPIPNMQAALEREGNVPIHGRLLLKRDDQLAVAGSVKARGGIYEILKHAETLAQDAGLLREGMSYDALATNEFRSFFAGHTIEVGSTGNLGLSIGIISAALGFRVVVHMSSDARQWKKDLLRKKGVFVKEYTGDYGTAVEAGRQSCQNDPKRYFVDDEHSIELFLGYTTAASRLQKQLEEAAIRVDDAHPLFVYLPCGVGGAPGGITYGLKQLFGEHVHCFFVEPVACPAMLLGLATGLRNQISVQEVGLSGRTEADGLAVGRPSGLVCELVEPLLSGEFTAADDTLYRYLKLLWSSEGIAVEPSACASFAGVSNLLRHPASKAYLEQHGLMERLDNACHIAWSTGGSLVPPEIMETYLHHG